MSTALRRSFGVFSVHPHPGRYAVFAYVGGGKAGALSLIYVVFP